ncbi:hypothetical protein GCK72_004355 [Caenorhabditis remanei]|uniref:RBR-type E3 ubiquitin transferase n=1 Tax=Caenorhabditis remanei TaxID=31234 RepID=A0A6A5HB78_CAERE|nr:hypothetical protein GCK72_004355 [Caenorhabditis remanei]KAF1764407.1 hypothetical protein GCK72_004355 [Caenorhabditis remanei]
MDSNDEWSDFGIDSDDHDDDDGKEVEKTILTFSDIQEAMQSQIADIQSVFGMSNGECRVWLQKFNWGKEKVMEHFYENPDFKNSNESSGGPTEDQICDICCEETQLIGLHCNHLACLECWKAYLAEKIKEGKSQIGCIGSDCKQIIHDEKIQEFLEDPKILEGFVRNTVNAYVETSRCLIWCPGTNCGNAIKSLNLDPHHVTCSCGTRFCFSCGQNPHEPVTCALLKIWSKKCLKEQDNISGAEYSSDKETLHWVLSNTKDCPKCNTAIEKNGGCNKMTCRSAKCRYKFCWLCLKDWAVHGYGYCNVFTQNTEETRDSRADLLRFLFFYNRFKAHEQSLELEKKLRSKVSSQLEDSEGISCSDVKSLEKTINILSESRHTLMYTYIFAYYLEQNNQSIIFESNQKDLEMATEQLSGYLEQDWDFTNKSDFHKILDKSRYVEHRRNVLLEHCAQKDGLELNTTGVSKKKKSSGFKRRRPWRMVVIVLAIVVVFIINFFLWRHIFYQSTPSEIEIEHMQSPLEYSSVE